MDKDQQHPHLKEQLHPHLKEQLQSVSPPPKLQPAPLADKENALPQESVGKAKRESRKLEALKEGVDAKMKPRSECKLEAAGIDETGGKARENLVLEETRKGNEKR